MPVSATHQVRDQSPQFAQGCPVFSTGSSCPRKLLGPGQMGEASHPTGQSPLCGASTPQSPGTAMGQKNLCSLILNLDPSSCTPNPSLTLLTEASLNRVRSIYFVIPSQISHSPTTTSSTTHSLTYTGGLTRARHETHQRTVKSAHGPCPGGARRRAGETRGRTGSKSVC